jgi:hypothetical protein
LRSVQLASARDVCRAADAGYQSHTLLTRSD